MNNEVNTPEQSIDELSQIRSRVAELERDLSEALSEKDALRERETQFRRMVESISDVVFEIDHQGVVVYFSPIGKDIWGYDPENIIGKNFVELVHPDDRDILIKRFVELSAGVEKPLNYRLKDKYNNYRWVRTSTKTRIVNGIFVGASGTLIDITDQKKVEEALRKSEDRAHQQRIAIARLAVDDAIASGDVPTAMQRLTEEASAAIQIERASVWLLSEDDKNLRCITLFEANAKKHSEGAILKSEDYPRCYFEAIRARSQINAGDARTGEFTADCLIPPGIISMLDAWIQMDGKLAGVVCFEHIGEKRKWHPDEEAFASTIAALVAQTLAIAKRKRTEESLRQSEAQYRLLADHMKDQVWLMDLNLKPTYISPSVEKSRGYTFEEIQQLPLDKHLTAASLQSAMEFFSIEMAKALADPTYLLKRSLELEFYCKDGSTVWVESTFSLIRNENGRPLLLLGVGRDITERKLAEDKLRESEKKYRDLYDFLPIPVYEMDFEANITSANRAIYETFRGTEEDVKKGLNAGTLVSPKDFQKSQQNIQRLLEGEQIGGTEYTLTRLDGSTFPAIIISRLIYSNGTPVGLGGAIVDITERKLAEEEKRSMEERLIRAEKMEALGTLAGGVAHDLNNVLGVLSGYSELLLLEIPEGHRSRGHVKKILQSTEKGAAIIEDLLTLARRGVSVSDVINLNSVVSGFLQTPVFEKIKDYHSRVTFRTECDKNLLNITGSPLHLEKTLMNLVANAAESISGKGEVTIRTESRHLDKATNGYDEIKQGDYAVLTVSDTGMGIPAENREKIFEPFYSKKTMGRSGTGLGLAIVWGTVKDNNGYIDIQTEVGQGTTFTLYFPVTREELIAQQQKVPIKRYMGEGESVLVVDDIAEQRDIAARLLTQLGYEVHVVPSGEKAVEYLKGNKADILVLDMIMAPGIDGLETYQRVLEINPRQKAILVSGFSETERVKEAQKLGAGAYVKKPYAMAKIGAAIREELNRMDHF